MRAGLIASTLLNCQRTKTSDRLWTWQDFFGDMREETAGRQSRFELQFQLEMTARKIKKKQGKLQVGDGAKHQD